jgi:hypothetical protein
VKLFVISYKIICVEKYLFSILGIILFFVIVYLNDKKDQDPFAKKLLYAVIIFLIIASILLTKD